MTLEALCRDIHAAYEGKITFHGHREVAAKACPVIDYKAILELDTVGRLGLNPAARGKAILIGRLHPDVAVLENAEAKRVQNHVMREGARGPDIKTLQERLTELGYHVGRIDGHFGKRTRAAVLAFQADNHLIADGKVGNLTLEVMERASPREIAPERAQKTVFGLASDGSRIARASISTGLAGTALSAGGALQLFTGLSETVGTITDAAGPFRSALEALGPWLGVLVIGAGVFIVWQASVAAQARTEDHRTGKTA